MHEKNRQLLEQRVRMIDSHKRRLIQEKGTHYRQAEILNDRIQDLSLQMAELLQLLTPESIDNNPKECSE